MKRNNGRLHNTTVTATGATRSLELLIEEFLHFLWCVAQRSLHAVTKVYYRSMSCSAMVPQQMVPACSAKISCIKQPLLQHVVQAVSKECHKD
jgi:hypothetical protein